MTIGSLAGSASAVSMSAGLASGGLDFAVSAEVAALGAEAAQVGNRWAAALDIREDSWLRGVSHEFALELGRRGWLGMCWPTEYGGAGRSPLERFVVVEALIGAGAPLASCWFADRQIGPTLLQFGTDEQRAQFLPPIVSGEAMWCIGMSEPEAGSDVASLRTSAVRRGDEWVLNGSKVWTSGAAGADWCYVIARTDPAAPAHAGLSEFIVDMGAPGVQVRPIRDMTGEDHFCEVMFDEVAVPESRRVGVLHGAFRQIMRQMEHERGGIDRLVSNRRLYLDAVGSLGVGSLGVGSLGDCSLGDGCDGRGLGSTVRDAWLGERLGYFESRYCIGRLMVLREVMGQAYPGFSAVTKTWCTEFEVEVASFVGELLGPGAIAGSGAGLDTRASRNICYAPGYTIMGGTTQILRNICAERILGLPR